MAQQNLLNLRIRDSSRFENFIEEAGNSITSTIKKWLQTSSLTDCSGDNEASSRSRYDNHFPGHLFLTGPPGSGKTHLLESVVYSQQHSIYIPLREIKHLGPGILENIASYKILCIDDIDVIANDHEFEEALFKAYIDSESTGQRWIIAATNVANKIPFSLSDLKSRLNACINLLLAQTTDYIRRETLLSRAQIRGMTIKERDVNHILNHAPRDMHSLMKLLDHLDTETMRLKSSITRAVLKSAIAQTRNENRVE